MKYRITHTTKYAYGDAVATCHNLVHLAPRNGGHPRDGGHQTRSAYRLIIFPEPADLVERFDIFGNQVEYFSIQQAHRGLSLSATSEVTVAERPAPPVGPAWEEVRDALPRSAGGQGSGASKGGGDIADAEVLPYRYTFPSPLAPTDPLLADYAAASFVAGRPIVDALRDLTSRIHDDFEYNSQATTVSTPVRVAFEQRAGVCQDFAQVAIACLRSIGLAARYVSGYLRTLPAPGKPRLVGADESHAWLSLYCGPEIGWVDADPTNNKLADTDYVTVAHGRDYSDVCPIQGVYVGGGEHSLSVSVDVAPVE